MEDKLCEMLKEIMNDDELDKKIKYSITDTGNFMKMATEFL